MINHHILRLDIPVHDANGVAVMQPLQNLIEIIFALFGFDDF